MAIKQSITSVSGAITEYHRISQAMLDYNQRKAYITVLSYLGAAKRDEEKAQSNKETELKEKERALQELVTSYNKETDTPELNARRVELTNQVNALYERTPDDVAPRNIFEKHYEIDLPTDTDFNLEFAYGWLKENIYTSSEDC